MDRDTVREALMQAMSARVVEVLLVLQTGSVRFTSESAAE